MRLNDLEKYTEACGLFVENEGLLDTPLLVSHFALSKVALRVKAAILKELRRSA